MNFLWTSYELLVSFLWIPYILCKKILWILTNVSTQTFTNLLQISHKFLTNILKTSYKHLKNFLQTFYTHTWTFMSFFHTSFKFLTFSNGFHISRGKKLNYSLKFVFKMIFCAIIILKDNFLWKVFENPSGWCCKYFCGIEVVLLLKASICGQA